jgi:hypothetical protein
MAGALPDRHNRGLKMKRRSLLHAALGAAVALSIAPVASADGGVPEPEPLQAKKPSQKAKNAVIVESVNPTRGRDSDIFSGITPCVKVQRTVWDQALAGLAHNIKFKLRYQSGGKNQTRKALVALKGMRLLGDDPNLPGYVRLDTLINVADKPVDEGVDIKGTAKLKLANSANKK